MGDFKKEQRVKSAKEELLKRKTNHYDKSKNYVICSKCIEDGLAVGSGKKNFTHRHDELRNHLKIVHKISSGPVKLYEFHHQDSVSVLEKRKQPTLSVTFY